MFAKILLAVGLAVVSTCPGASGVTFLRQSDFSSGSVVIDTPGTYVLQEDITFEPNAGIPFDSAQPEAYLFPTDAQRKTGEYSSDAFTLGFFAAIVVQADDVVIDLNGYRLEQSMMHALMQRFFALIEIASAPFPPGKGPAAFSDEKSFQAANGVVIQNGTLGRSSHHSIHGNNCKQVTLVNLTLTDFEVAGVSLNKANVATLENLDVVNSRQDVPVSGRFSQAIFALRAATVMLDLDSELDAYGDIQSAVNELRQAVSRVVTQVAANEEVDNRMFQSVTRGLPDGSLLAGVVFHPIFHVGAFLKPEQHEYGSSRISLNGVRITNLSAAPVEIATLVWDEEGGASVHDNVGAVFDIDTIRDPQTEAYVPNPLANLQLALARYAIECESVATSVPRCLTNPRTKKLLERNTIGQSVIDWCLGKYSFTDMLARTRYKVVGDHDYMFHFNKGVVGVKIDGVVTATLVDVEVLKLENHATVSQRSMFFQRAGSYTGYGTRAFAISSSANVTGNIHAQECFSEYGSDVMALDVRHNSTNTVLELDALLVPTKKYSITGKLPIKDPMFRRSGCPFANPASTGEEKSAITDFEVGFYVLLATQICSLLALAACAYLLVKPNHPQRKAALADDQGLAKSDRTGQEELAQT